MNEFVSDYNYAIDTVRIKTADGEIIINRSDFDPDTHKLAPEPKPAKADPSDA